MFGLEEVATVGFPIGVVVLTVDLEVSILGLPTGVVVLTVDFEEVAILGFPIGVVVAAELLAVVFGGEYGASS
jgi:hypothetical protein